jgi:hypothetical protein
MFLKNFLNNIVSERKSLYNDFSNLNSTGFGLISQKKARQKNQCSIPERRIVF